MEAVQNRLHIGDIEGTIGYKEGYIGTKSVTFPGHSVTKWVQRVEIRFHIKVHKRVQRGYRGGYRDNIVQGK